MTLQESYLYLLDLDWTGRRSGELKVEGAPPVAFSAPPEFSGDPDLWTPEHLLVAATSSCLMTTFLAIAERSNLKVHSYRCRAFGRLEKVPGEGYRFTEIALAPEISIAGEDVEKALRVLEKAEKNCFISNSLRAKVKLEPHITPAGGSGSTSSAREGAATI
jgi:peroxiredoxin-like protein